VDAHGMLYVGGVLGWELLVIGWLQFPAVSPHSSQALRPRRLHALHIRVLLTVHPLTSHMTHVSSHALLPPLPPALHTG
jgi:hypothetical protein